jgi:hypothetical protein
VSASPAKEALLAIPVPSITGASDLPGTAVLPADALPFAANSTPSAHSPPAARTAYLLNTLLPGSGNAYYGQKAMSALLLIAIVLAIATPFAPDKSMLLGLVFSAISGVLAFFTAGESLLVGLPIGLLLVLQSAGPVVSAALWLFSLAASQFLIKSAAKARPA